MLYFLELTSEQTELLGSFLYGLFLFGVLFGLCCLYFYPVIVAIERNNPHSAAITIITIFGGWSVIGWFFALFLAYSSGDSRKDRRMQKRLDVIRKQKIKRARRRI